MERKYFIRTKDFCEIISDENYVKIITGEWSKFGEEEIIDKTDVKNFEDKEQQKQYFDEKVDYYSNSGYVECERAIIIPSLEELDLESDNYDEISDIFDFWGDKSEFNNEIYKLYDNISCRHLCISIWHQITICEKPTNIINYLIKNNKNYTEVEYFTIGNAYSEISEISWINQLDYTEFFKAFPNIKGMFIQGSEGLKLGKMNLPKLEILELQGSGLRNEVLEDITNSNLPNLKRLNLYFGVENYGCDVEIEYVKNLLNNTNFEKLEILGLCNIDINLFSNVLEVIFESKYSKQIKVLDISKSCSTDKDAEYIIKNIKKLENINYIDLNYNYISNHMVLKLRNLLKRIKNVELDFSDNQEPYKYSDESEGRYYTMYTE